MGRARDGSYGPLTTWSVDGDALRGAIELPLAVAHGGRPPRAESARAPLAARPRRRVGTRPRGGDGGGRARARTSRRCARWSPRASSAVTWRCTRAVSRCARARAAERGDDSRRFRSRAGRPTTSRSVSTRRSRAHRRASSASSIRDGYWHAPLEANVGMDAQYVIFNRFMGRRRQETEQRLVAHMQAVQSRRRELAALPRRSGPPEHDDRGVLRDEARRRCRPTIRRCARAREFIRAHGGLERAGVFTRTFLAYFGQFPWWGLPAMPVELVLLPPWFPLNIYAMSSWARETVVPLTVLMAKQPRIAIAGRVRRRGAVARAADAAERRLSAAAASWLSRGATSSWRSTGSLKRLGRSPWKPLRARARCARAERVDPRAPGPQRRLGRHPAADAQLRDGAARARLSPTTIRRSRRASRRSRTSSSSTTGQLFFQPCVSPTWDTALTCKALLDSGVARTHPGAACAPPSG